MNQAQQCQFCDLPFDIKIRIPRILNLCEHLICERCIKEHIKRGFPITCDQDGIVYNVKFDSLDDFKEEKNIIQALQNGIMEKDEEYDNSSNQNSEIVSNSDILSEDKSDTMNYKDSYGQNIDSQNDTESIKFDLQKKNTNDSQSDIFGQKNINTEYDEYSVKNSMINDFDPNAQNNIQMNSSISAISQNEDDQLQINPPDYNSESEEIYVKQNYIDDKIDSDESDDNIQIKQNMNYCTMHNMNQEEICLECATRICAKCAVYGLHQNHNKKIMPEKLFYEEAKKYKIDVDKWLNKISQQDEFLKYEFIDNTFKKESYKKQQELQEEIDQIFKKAFQQLQKQKDLLIANMKDRFSSIQKYLQDEINASIQQVRPQMLQVQTELQSIKQTFARQQNEKALFQIMRDREELNIRNSVKSIVHIQKNQYQKFQKKANYFIENAKLVRNQDLNFDVAQLKTEALVNHSVFIESEGEHMNDGSDEDIIDLRDNNINQPINGYINFQNQPKNLYNSFANLSQYENQPPMNRKYTPMPVQQNGIYQMKQNLIMHQSMIEKRPAHFRNNSSFVGYNGTQHQYLNQSTVYHGQQSPIYENNYQHQQNSIIQDDYNSARNSFNGSNSKNKLTRKNTLVEKNLTNENPKQKINSELKRKIQAFIMSKSQTLDLNNQKIKDEDIFTITQLLQKKPGLKNLLMKRNRFTDKAIQILCKELEGTTLKVLDVSNNNLSTKSLNHMLKLAEKNSRIKKIIFKDIPMKLNDKNMYQDFFTKLNVALSIQFIFFILDLINQQIII